MPAIPVIVACDVHSHPQQTTEYSIVRLENCDTAVGDAVRSSACPTAHDTRITRECRRRRRNGVVPLAVFHSRACVEP